MAVTLSDLILDAKRMSDMQNSKFVLDDEWLSYANREMADLHGEFAELSEDYWMNNVTFTLPFVAPPPPSPFSTLPKNAFPLPVDFHKIRGLDYQVDAGNQTWRTLRHFPFNERNALTPDIRRLFGASPDRRWYIMGGVIWIIPESQPDGVFRMWYTQVFAPAVTTADQFPNWEGMHEIVILGVAIRALEKEESDALTLREERERLRERIRSRFRDRNEAEADVIQDRQGIDMSPYGRFEPW